MPVCFTEQNGTAEVAAARKSLLESYITNDIEAIEKSVADAENIECEGLLSKAIEACNNRVERLRLNH